MNNYGPRIVTDGLVLCLDAADRNSYPGSGTTWKDLSGNGYDATVRGSRIAYSSSDNSFDFTGTGDTSTGNTDGISISVLNYLTGGSDQITNMTLDFWIKCNSGTTSHIGDQRILISFDRSSVFRFAIGSDAIANISGRPSFMFTGNAGTNDIYAYGAPDLRDDSWHHVCVTYIPTQTFFYIDSQQYSSNASHNNIIGSQSTTESPRYGWIGNGSEATSDPGIHNPPSFFYGKIASCKYYYSTLSPTQILQNYQATKGRFGL